MEDEDLEASDIERKVHNLAEAMNRVRTAQADRDDVVVDMKHAKISRLELLAEDLTEVRDDIPDNIEQFEFAVTNGEAPRLWIDMISFVRMVADGREYEFVKDTRLGRTILGRSANRDLIGKIITDYVAERILERERMIEGDWLLTKGSMEEMTAEETSSKKVNSDEQPEQPEEENIAVSEKPAKPSAMTSILTGLVFGLAVVLLVVVFDKTGAVSELWQGIVDQLKSLINR